MRIKSITVDPAQIFAVVVAIVFGMLGLVSWYAIILIVLFTFHLTLEFPI